VSEPVRTGWRRRSAWHGLLSDGRFGTQGAPAGVVVTAIEDHGMATVIGRAADEVDAYFKGAHGLTPPRRPAVVVGSGCALVWAGPNQWLAASRERSLPARLAEGLRESAAVSDQSDARALLHLSGPNLRDALAKGCPIDLHARTFKPGDAAVTTIAHVGVHLWWLPDDYGFHVAVFRSMAGSFWSWLCASAAEFGLVVVTPHPPAR
jgi:methylglutamate dehydrogenase subunit D